MQRQAILLELALMTWSVDGERLDKVVLNPEEEADVETFSVTEMSDRQETFTGSSGMHFGVSTESISRGLAVIDRGDEVMDAI